MSDLSASEVSSVLLPDARKKLTVMLLSRVTMGLFIKDSCPPKTKNVLNSLFNLQREYTPCPFACVVKGDWIR